MSQRIRADENADRADCTNSRHGTEPVSSKRTNQCKLASGIHVQNKTSEFAPPNVHRGEVNQHTSHYAKILKIKVSGRFGTIF